VSGTDDDVRIIKHGPYYKKVVRFECGCGCVYETSDTNFSVGPVGVIFCTRCPDCNERNMKIESIEADGEVSGDGTTD